MEFWRPPTLEERNTLALEDIHAGLTDFEAVYSQTILDFSAEAAALIGEWIAKGKLTAADLADPDTLASFPGRDLLYAELRDLLGKMGEFGKAEVVREIGRLGNKA